MRKIKSLPLLLCVAVVAAAFAVPATASATSWTRYGNPLLENIGFGFSGYVAKEVIGAPGNGFECYASGKGELFAGTDKGEIKEFNFDSKKCVGFGGSFKNCILTSSTTTTPWSIQAVAEGEVRKILINNFGFTWNFTNKSATEKCNIPSWTIESNLTAIPDNPLAMSTLSVSGPTSEHFGASKPSVGYIGFKLTLNEKGVLGISP